MALEDILGRTPEIRIIDFLATNYGNSYNQSEICEFTGISRNILYKKLPEMVDRDLLEVDNSVGRFKSYKLADNSIVNKLIAIDIEHNLVTSDMPGKETLIEQQEPENPETPMENRYYQAPDEVNDIRTDNMIPVTIDMGEKKDDEGLIFMSRPAAKRLYLSLKEALNNANAGH